MNILEEIEEIAKKEFDSWTPKEFMSCAVRLLALELFLRYQVSEDNEVMHVWLTSSNHPLLLKVIEEEGSPLSEELLDSVTKAFETIMDVDQFELARIVSTILQGEEDLEY